MSSTTPAVSSAAELLWLSIEDLGPNEFNANVMAPDMYQKARASIREFGFVDPITVRFVGPHSTPFEIIDGEHRWRAARDEGYGMVPVFNLGEVDDDVAKQLSVVLNETRGQADPTKLGNLLRDLAARHSVESLLARLPYEREQFMRLAAIPTMEMPTLTRPEPPSRPVQRWVERIYRFPPDAAEVLDEAIARVKADAADLDMPDWRAIELLGADYLGG